MSGKPGSWYLISITTGPSLPRVFNSLPRPRLSQARRNPDSKWRLRPAALAKRQEEQREALARGAALVKPGGRMIYVTCSVLPEENGDQIAAFLDENSAFSRDALDVQAQGRLEAGGPGTVQFTPLKTGCDGFFVAALKRSG